MMNGVLHHHDGAVHDHAEVDGAEAHQVGADAEQAHAKKTDQHGTRNDGGRDQRRAQISEEEQQDDGDQNEPFEEILLDRVDGAVDYKRLVVERRDFDPGRQPQTA